LHFALGALPTCRCAAIEDSADRISPEKGSPYPYQSRSVGRCLSEGLRELGYIDGKTILIEQRYAEGKSDRIPRLVAELVQLNVDVLVFGSFTGNPRSQAGYKDNPYRHDNPSRSGRGRSGRQLGAPRRQYHRTYETHSRPERKKIGGA
jgi:hypothetical protein